MKCEKCNKRLKAIDKFCEYCGTEVKTPIIKDRDAKTKKVLISLFLIIICLFLIIFANRYIKRIPHVKHIKEELNNIEYDKLKISLGKSCTKITNGFPTFGGIKGCTHYDIKIYMNKNDIVHAEYEIFKDGRILIDNTNTNINNYINMKKKIANNFNYEYEKMELYESQIYIYINNNLDNINENFLRIIANFYSKLEPGDLSITFSFNLGYRIEGYKYIENENEIKLIFTGPHYYQTTIINEETNYKEEIEHIKSRK